MSSCANAEEALAFVRDHGVVLVAAKGSVPNLVEAIAGHPIKGSWWAHPDGKRIFTILGAVTESEEVLVCRLIRGKVTLVHERLWPSLVRVANRLAPGQIARVREEHTPSGRHVTHETPFPEWVPATVSRDAQAVDEQAALTTFGPWLPLTGPQVRKARH